MSDSKDGDVDMSNSSVTDSAATQAASAQPQSATEAAKQLLSEWRSQGKDYIGGELGRKQARQAVAILKTRGVECKDSVIYKARKELKNDGLKVIDKALANELDGKVTQDDDFSGGQPVKKVEDMLNNDGSGGSDKSQASGGATGQPDLEGSQEKKFEPLPIEQTKDIIDVCIDGVGEVYAEMQKPIRPKSIDAVKTAYGKTMEVYNASLPKWLLPVICVVLTVLVFALPFRKEIKGALFGDANDGVTVPPTIEQ